MLEDNNNLLSKSVKLNNTEIPVIPFLWYREQESTCPVNSIKKINRTQVKKDYNYDLPIDPFILEQLNICAGQNIYISIHSLMYYMMHKDQFQNKDVVKIDATININKNWQVMIIPLNNSKIIEINGGLKVNQYTTGSVYIHNESFSPPGTLHFKVDETVIKTEFLCLIKNDELKVNMACIYILKNEFDPLFC